VADLFGEQAAAKTRFERLLQETFERWGYQRIIVPTFEYYDTLATNASPQMQQDMYRFFDREGHEMALRTDMTVPTARVVGTRLYDQPLPLRFYYAGNVFRYKEPQAGQLREFTQAGIELVGADTPEADAEVVAVAVAALKALRIERFQINLGEVAYLRAIVGEVGLANDGLHALEQAISRKNDLEIAQTLADLGIGGGVARAVRAIPHLCGDAAVLDEALSLATNEAAHEAIGRLRRVYELLALEGIAEHIILDLGEVRSMDYYTGVTFHGYVAGLGFHVCSGGRYDGLLAHFGPDMAAVGFALGVERAMLVAPSNVNVAPDLLVAACDHGACRALAARARAQGLRVEMDVLRRDVEELLTYARLRCARRLLLCGAEFTLIEGEQRLTLTHEALEEEMRTWTS
jgi:ATP phosphoribosyltransferase regulatory subunit